MGRKSLLTNDYERLSFYLYKYIMNANQDLNRLMNHQTQRHKKRRAFLIF